MPPPFRWIASEEPMIRWPAAFTLLSLLVGSSAFAAAPTTQPLHLTREQDRQRMLDLLHITAVKPARDNYDEALANPYPALPDPLVLNDGERVTDANTWWTKRRPEILELFEREIYGRTPAQTPAVTWQAAGVTNNGTIITKQLVGHVDNSAFPAINVDIHLTLTTPAGATGPVPVIIQFYSSVYPRRPTSATAPVAPTLAAGPTWQQQVLSRGWGYATLDTASVQADNGAGLTAGIIGLVNKGQPRALDDWGVLSAWAWGASRALDYFQTDKSVDATQVGLEGHSRWGKATLLAMALDQRFAIAYVSSSGEGGAKLHRHNYGESLDDLCGFGEYDWMAGNFLKYAGHWNDLPVDSHELIALCAPRPVFLSGGTYADRHSDTEGMFMATAAAGPVYKLLGKKDMGVTKMAAPDVALIDGDLGFRQHEGGHTDALDWPTFLKFADHYIKLPPAASAP
jgi:hypothetical protein